MGEERSSRLGFLRPGDVAADLSGPERGHLSGGAVVELCESSAPAGAGWSLWGWLDRYRGDRLMAVSIDLPLDPQQVNESGWPWTLLDEAADPARVRPGAVLVAGDPSDPVWVRVGELVPLATVTKVRVELLEPA